MLILRYVKRGEPSSINLLTHADEFLIYGDYCKICLLKTKYRGPGCIE